VSDLLTVDSLTVVYGGNRALSGVNLKVGRGAFVGVVGSNGAGKSSLINGIAGWSRGAPKISGTVMLNGADVSRLPAHRRTKQGVVLVPEGKGVFDGLTVDQTLDLVRDPPAEEGRTPFSPERIREIFTSLDRRRHHRGSALSGGERQMLAIGRALRSAPRILLLDEPSVSLAPRVILSLLEIIRRLVDDGLSVLLVEQNVRATLEVVDYVYLLERGAVVAEGPTAAMRNEPRVVQAYLGEQAS
jgi:branched-chain amino acid transport system ATP-binding protein